MKSKEKIKTVFCTNCLKETECEYFEEYKQEVIDNYKIEYLEKFYICSSCDSKIYGDLLDYNILEVNKKLRDKANLIEKKEIQ